MVVGGGVEGGRVVTFMDGSYQLDGLRTTVFILQTNYPSGRTKRT